MVNWSSPDNCGWKRLPNTHTAHYWRLDAHSGRLVSLCNLIPTKVRKTTPPGRCPVCAEGLARAELVRAFFERHVHLDAEAGGQLMTVEPWYWENVLLPIYGTLKRGPQGQLVRVYTRALIGVARWHIKSTTAGGLALYHMALEPMVGAESYCVATSLGQAAAIFDKTRRIAKGDPWLARLFDVKRKVIEQKETEASFRSLPHNADTAQGFHPQFCAIDELHVHKDAKMLNAMTSGAAGYSEGLVLVITTAGAERKGVWWEALKDWPDDPGTYVYWCGATDDDDPTAPATWKKANPASWMTKAKLRKQYQKLPLPEFMRYHLNLAPKRGQNKVIPEPMWAACGEPPVFDPERPVVLGIDASLKRDHTAIVMDQVGEDGVHNLMCFSFEPDDEGGILGSIDHDEIGALLRELAESYIVTRAPTDRAYFIRTMRELLSEGFPIEEFAQNNQNMGRACQRFYDVLSAGRMRHGNDPVLTQHVLAAGMKPAQQWGYRFTKTEEGDHIDAAIAAAMAVDVAEVEAEEQGIGVLVG